MPDDYWTNDYRTNDYRTNDYRTNDYQTNQGEVYAIPISCFVLFRFVAGYGVDRYRLRIDL